MRKSLNEIQQIEQYLLGDLPPGESTEFNTRLATSSDFYEKFELQKEVYRLLKIIFRRKLKREIQLIQNQLFTNPQKQSFQQKIKAIFK